MKTTPGLGCIDKRLAARSKFILTRIIEKRSCVLHQLSNNWEEEMGMWRFLKNDRFSWESLRKDCLSDMPDESSGRHVLSIQDGSTISLYGYLKKRQGFGKMGSRGDHPGFVVHPSLVLSADDGRCLGLGDMQIHDGQMSFDQICKQGDAWRKAETKTKKSGVWLQCGKSARQQLQNAAQVTHIADREADFFEMLLEFGQKKVANEHLIVRSNHDRHLGHVGLVGKSPYKGEPDICIQTGFDTPPIQLRHRALVSQLLEILPLRAVIQVNLPATHKRKKRTATLAIRFAEQIPICRPIKASGRIYEGQTLPGSVRIAIVEAREITPDLPPDQTPVYWRLYTSHDINSVEDALQIIKWYTWRWKIELFFAVIKSSGLNLEHALIEHAPRLKKLAILVAMAAVKIIQLLQAREGESDQLLTDLFTEQEITLLNQINPKLEGNTEKQKNPHPKNSLPFAVWIIARLGGWKGYKTHRPPGIKTISRGLNIFYQIKTTAEFLSG